MLKKQGIISLVILIAIMLTQTVFAAGTNSVLEINVVGQDSKLELSLEDLKAMPAEAQIDEDYTYNTKTGEKTVHVKGVSLAYLLREKAGVRIASADVLMEASDGYVIDPQSLANVLSEDYKYVVAYEVDGNPVDDDDNPDNEEIKIYKKQQTAGEFNTVFKMINKITVGEPIEAPVPTTEEPQNEEINFTDITEEFEYAKNAIAELSKKGIIDGIGNNLYAPEEDFTRAQFCKIIVESLNLEQKPYEGGFSDVAVSDWHANYIQAAVESGLFKGYTDGTFMPDKAINRQEIASVAARAAVVYGKVSQEKLDKFVMEKSAYIDKDDVPEWAANAVAWLEAQGVFTDFAAEKFEPTLIINRAQAAVVVYKTLFAE
jgi:hypothetical protein